MAVLESAKSFHVREQISRTDCFEVFTGEDRKEVSYEIHEKLLSFYRKSLYNKNGKRLFKMEVDQASLVQTTYMENVLTNVKYKIQKKGFMPCFGRNRLQVFEGLETPKEKYHVLSSKVVRNEFEIIDSETDTVVATVKRKLNTRTLAWNLHSYDIKIIRDADEAFILMLAVIIDGQYFEYVGETGDFLF